MTLYDCSVSAHQCIFNGNGGIDVSNDSKSPWDFQRNYWGPSVTRLLLQKGDSCNLPNINDGRDTSHGNIVDIADFLTAPPENCGSTLKK